TFTEMIFMEAPCAFVWPRLKWSLDPIVILCSSRSTRRGICRGVFRGSGGLLFLPRRRKGLGRRKSFHPRRLSRGQARATPAANFESRACRQILRQKHRKYQRLCGCIL